MPYTSKTEPTPGETASGPSCSLENAMIDEKTNGRGLASAVSLLRRRPRRQAAGAWTVRRTMVFSAFGLNGFGSTQSARTLGSARAISGKAVTKTTGAL